VPAEELWFPSFTNATLLPETIGTFTAVASFDWSVELRTDWSWPPCRPGSEALRRLRRQT